MKSNIIETLRGNGYMADIATIEGVERQQVIGATHDWYYASSADYAAGKQTPMRDANPSLAVLEFKVGDASPISVKFSDALVALLAPVDRLLRKHTRPLVRMTPALTQFVYQSDTPQVGMRDDTPGHRPLFENGLAFADCPNQFSLAHLRADCGNVLLDDAQWLGDRTPLTVPRTDLPTWDRDEMARKLRALVDQYVAAGELRELEAYKAPTIDGSPEAQLARQGVRIVPPTDDRPPPIQHNDPRLQRALKSMSLTHPDGFWLDGKDEGGEHSGTGFGRARG